jgi:hypothetical protein
MTDGAEFHTREIVSYLRKTVVGLPRNARLPDVPASHRALKELSAIDAAPAEPEPNALDQVRERLKQARTRPGGIRTASPRDIRAGVWLLWSQNEPLFTLPGLFEAILREASRRSSTRRNLIEAWIRDFNPRSPGIEEAGPALRWLVSDSQDVRLSRWEASDQQFSFFDPRSGPASFAGHILNASEPVEAILDKGGFLDPLRSVSGYMVSVQSKLTDIVSQELRQNNGHQLLERALAFVAPGGRWRFQENKGEVAKALLSPWLRTGPVPSDTTRDQVRSFLLAQFGDPRIRRGDWAKVGPEGVRLMLRWLAGISLKGFFELIAEHALDEHFKYRRAFWSAYLDADAIVEAQLALGKQVYNRARSIPALRHGFVRLEGQGVSPNQSIIILRIGDLVFCEWSHSGRIRAWKANSENAPRLDQQTSFVRGDVTKPCLQFPRNRFGRGGSRDEIGLAHFNSQDSYWQESVAALIHQYGGPLLERRFWSPK